MFFTIPATAVIITKKMSNCFTIFLIGCLRWFVNCFCLHPDSSSSVAFSMCLAVCWVRGRKMHLCCGENLIVFCDDDVITRPSLRSLPILIAVCPFSCGQQLLHLSALLGGQPPSIRTE